MKKCKECQREIDKYAIACQYCGKYLKLEEREREEQKKTASNDHEKEE